MKRSVFFFLAVVLLIALSCGDSKIEVKSTLLVVDTYPSQGAEVEPSLSDILVFFSSKIDTGSVSNDSFLLELVGAVDTDIAGSKVNTEILDVSEDKTGVHLKIKDTPLTGGSIYRLTISNVKSATGETLEHKYYRFFSVKSR